MARFRRSAQRRSRYEAMLSPVLADLYRFALRLTRDPTTAEDLLQQASLTAFEKLDQLSDEGAFRVWVSRIVYRTHLNARRRTRETLVDAEVIDNVVALEPRPGPAERAGARQLGRQLALALDHLPAEQREAVWLVDGQGFKYAEAADILGIRPGTAASRVARGRLALRVRLEDVARDEGVIR